MIIAKHIKQPAESKIYAIDCSGWLDGRELDITDGEFPRVRYEKEKGSDFIVDWGLVRSVDGVKSLYEFKVSGGLDGQKVFINIEFRTNTYEIYEDEVLFIIKEVG